MNEPKKTPDGGQIGDLSATTCYAPSDRDWTKDFAHENGNYMCRCVTCKERFTGHKRRVVCKKCHDEAEAWFASLTPEQQAIETANKEAAIREWFALHNVADQPRPVNGESS